MRIVFGIIVLHFFSIVLSLPPMTTTAKLRLLMADDSKGRDGNGGKLTTIYLRLVLIKKLFIITILLFSLCRTFYFFFYFLYNILYTVLLNIFFIFLE